MTISQKKDITLYNAIDNYSLLTNNQKKVLKVMVKISVNYEVAATIKDLQEMTKVARASISTAVTHFDQQGIIKSYDVRGGKFTGCTLQHDKLEEIKEHYHNKQQIIRR